MHLLNFLVPVLLILAVVFLSMTTRKLTPAAALTGGIIAALIFAGAGYAGLAMLGTFFVLGTVATSWKKQQKLLFRSVSDRSPQRTAGQVFANGGIAGMLGFLILLLPARAELLRIMMAASLASAIADTLSSELGMIYGKRFFNIISFKKDEKGLDGVVSLEGTLIGVAGSFVIAVIYNLGFNQGLKTFLLIVIAGTLGNLADSVLGALLERKQYLTNDQVNFLNTAIAAFTACLGAVLL